MPLPPAVLLDANVLHSNQQRNLILQLAAQELVSVAWTVAIEDEWLRNTETGIRERIRSHTLPLIRKHFPDALIASAGPPFAPIGRTDADDLHIAAAAVKMAPCRLVTWNVDDFGCRSSRRARRRRPDAGRFPLRAPRCKSRARRRDHGTGTGQPDEIGADLGELSGNP